MKKLIYLIFIPLLMMGMGCSDDEKDLPKVQEIVVFDNASINNLSFVNDKIGYIAGTINYKIMTAEVAKTIDGGITWEIMPVYINGKPTNQITDIYAFSTNKVYATIALSDEQNGVYLSNDGGKSWNSIYQFKDNVAGHGNVFFKTEDIGFVGKIGDIWITNDGGETWKEVYRGDGSNGSGNVGDMKFTSDRIAYTYGGFANGSVSGGTIVKTTDGGETWVGLTSLTEFVTSLNFIDDNIGYAFTFDNNIYKTTDGGKSWILVKELDYGSYFGSVVSGDVKYFSTGNEIFSTANDFSDYKRIHRSQYDYIHSGARLSPNVIIFKSDKSIIRIQE